MQNHTFILEPYGNGKGTRHTCPSCNTKRNFARYINTAKGEYLADHVGRCNSENSCGYHFTPRQYFEENPEQQPTFTRPERMPEPKKKPSFIDSAYVASRRKGYDTNTFVLYLVGLFGIEITKHLIEAYDIGTCNERWPGAAIFWVKDSEGRARAGQVKHFDDNGHTGTYTDSEGNRQSKTGWVHKHLEFKYSRKQCTEKKPAWLTSYLENPECWPCLFGEHLLSAYPSKPVAIVEAPKTAIIASVYFPDFVWLAVGSKSNFSTNNTRRLSAIKGKAVCLFPDLKAFDDWSQKAERLSYLATFHTSDFLERNATEEEKEKGLDLADYLVRFSYSDFYRKNGNSPENCTNPTPDSTKEEKAASAPVELVHHYAHAHEEQPVSGPISGKQAENAQPETDTKPERAFIYQAKEQELWDISELEGFFAAPLPETGPIQLYPWARLTDPALFIKSHLAYLKANNGHRSALPHLERLQRLKSILEGTAIQTPHRPLLHSAA